MDREIRFAEAVKVFVRIDKGHRWSFDLRRKRENLNWSARPLRILYGDKYDWEYNRLSYKYKHIKKGGTKMKDVAYTFLWIRSRVSHFPGTLIPRMTKI